VAEYRIDASPETVHWGYFDAGLAPRLTVESGDTVTISTVSGGPEVMPQAPFAIPEALTAVHAAMRPKLPGHICTGPVEVRGARAGGVLEVRIKSIELHYDWGFTYVAPQKGALPDDFDEMHLMHIPLDRERMTGRLPWGLELPLRPFFGVMGVAPPASWRRCTSTIPRAFGGNIDNKELVAGTTLYLPVFVAGALFSCGDGHAVQGDGEVNDTALETALSGTFEFVLRKDLGLTYPRAETSTHLVTFGMDPDLDRCVEKALRDMIALVVERCGVTPEQAYALCSLAADLRITQTVNQHKGVHCMLAKHLLAGGN
jgi:acetamidase/formamidase